MSFNFCPFPVLETKRLLIRELNLNDTKAIFDLRTNKENNTFIIRNNPKNLSETRAFIDVISNLVADNKCVFWVIILKKNNKLIGTIGLRNFKDHDNYAEVGFELSPNSKKKGFMNEALQKIINFGFNNLHLKTIEAFTHKNNIASKALLEKCNFIFQPERRDKGFDNNIIYNLEAKE